MATAARRQPLQRLEQRAIPPIAINPSCFPPGLSHIYMMWIERVSNWEDVARLAPEWNRLARGIPFLTWEWLGAWWRHYGAGGPEARASELLVAAVYDATAPGASDELIALAPWYVERKAPRGAIVRFLGSGDVCSDYLTVLSAAGREPEVAAALAGWLIALRKENAGGSPLAWDRLEFGGIADDDETMGRLLEQLSLRGAIVDRRQAEHCWRVELPSRWEEYLAGLSKSHRKQLRRFQRRLFASGRAVLRTAATEREFRQAFEILVDLHRRRRESLGDRGCFHSGRFTEFHREVAWRFFERGLLRLSWLELDSRPVACEYQLLGGNTVYAYQSGIDPAALEEEPGRLATMATLRAAIESGCGVYDLLRGDEAYKAHWRARPYPCSDIRVLPGRGADWLRHGVWVARENLRSWVKAPWPWTSALGSADMIAPVGAVSADE
jgi:CelD/BcsL family acetyltransferase involved in cellulose biosynthesis